MHLLKADEGDQLVELMQPAKAFQKIIDGAGTATGLELRDGALYIGGQIVDNDRTNYTISQIMQFLADGLPTQPLINFYNRLAANPSYRVRNDLLRFLEHGQLPITDDGCFLAYKRVRENFSDVYTGKLDYTPGNIVSMPREEVDDDPNNTCSAGLHVCSYEYLAHFSGDKVLSCKVDPVDVVSIPTDYNDSKMRVCRLTVVEEIPMPTQRNVWESPVVNGWAAPAWVPKFKINDRVYIAEPGAEFEGEEGVIFGIDAGTCQYTVRFDDGERGYYEEESLEYATRNGDNGLQFTGKFKVGDKVVLREYPDFPDATVIRVNPHDRNYPYHIAFESIRDEEWVGEHRLRPASDFNLDATMDDFHVGDRVALTTAPGKTGTVVGKHRFYIDVRQDTPPTGAENTHWEAAPVQLRKIG